MGTHPIAIDGDGPEVSEYDVLGVVHNGIALNDFGGTERLLDLAFDLVSTNTHNSTLRENAKEDVQVDGWMDGADAGACSRRLQSPP